MGLELSPPVTFQLRAGSGPVFLSGQECSGKSELGPGKGLRGPCLAQAPDVIKIQTPEGFLNDYRKPPKATQLPVAWAQMPQARVYLFFVRWPRVPRLEQEGGGVLDYIFQGQL